MAWTEEDFERMLGRGQVRVVGEQYVPSQNTSLSQSIIEHALDIWHPTGVTLRLPVTPSTNHYWRSVIAGSGSRIHVKVLISEKGRRYRIDAGLQVLSQWPATIKRPLEGRVRLIAAIFPADKRTFDIDNRMKGLLDMLQVAGAYENDSQVDELRVIRCGVIGHPGCIVVQLSEIV